MIFARPSEFAGQPTAAPMTARHLDIRGTAESSPTVVGFPKPLGPESSDSTAAVLRVATNPGNGRSPLVSVARTSAACCADAVLAWNEHQDDRAWVEWGICWPPFTVRRPRCLACDEGWPCAAALGASMHLATCDMHLQ